DVPTRPVGLPTVLRQGQPRPPPALRVCSEADPRLARLEAGTPAVDASRVPASAARPADRYVEDRLDAPVCPGEAPGTIGRRDICCAENNLSATGWRPHSVDQA